MNAGEDFPALTAPVSEGRLAIAGDFLEPTLPVVRLAGAQFEKGL